MTLTNNVGKDDRIIRALVGLGFISLVFIGPETAWGWFGLVPLLTAIIGICPLYMKLGLDTSDPKTEAEVENEAEGEAKSADEIIQNREEADTDTEINTPGNRERAI